MKRGHLFATLAVVAAACTLAAFGCSRKKTIQTEEGTVTYEQKGDAVEVETPDGTMTITGAGDKMKIKTEEGEATISLGSGALPEGLSKDIPIYSPSEVAASQVLDEGSNVILSLSTKDDAAKVKKFYQDELGKNGWKINRTMNMGPASIISSSKGDSELNVTLHSDGSQTVISLAFQK